VLFLVAAAVAAVIAVVRAPSWFYRWLTIALCGLILFFAVPALVATLGDLWRG
jgi:hypothetical protein